MVAIDNHRNGLTSEQVAAGERAAYDGSPIRTAVNIHNPSIEAHILPAGAPNNTGAAIIVIGGGGHQVVVVREGADCIPFFAEHGISTIILRERLRVDGYDMTVDAMHDTFQAVRLVRQYAAGWRLGQEKIGVAGFSAGGELAAAAAVEYPKFNTLPPSGSHAEGSSHHSTTWSVAAAEAGGLGERLSGAIKFDRDRHLLVAAARSDT